MVKWAVSSILALLLAAPQAAIAVKDLDGRVSTPLAPATGEVNLVFFVSIDCPISARYSPEINRIIRDYAAKNVHAWLVYVDPQAKADAVRTNMKDFHPGIQAPAVIDAGLRLTVAADATVTPEAYVYTHAGRAYRGRIDDLYDAIGVNRRSAGRHDLREALDAVLAGTPVPTPETKPVGCFIERDIK
jgi:hypothetical protein